MTFSVFHFFQMHVFIWALLVAILVAFSASRVGVPLVLKRYSFAGFGLSKVAFMASALAIIIGLNNELFIVMPLTVGASILILRFGGRAKLRGDAVLAIISIAAIAIGFFLLNTFDSQGQVTQNVTAALFGTNLLILTTLTDVFIALGVAIFVAVILFVLHNRTFSVTFDSNFMRATGQKPIIYEFVIAAIVGVVIAISMQLVGSLLTSALIIFPALSAMRVAKTYKKVSIFASIIAVGSAIIGYFLALATDWAPGATIILFNLVVFLVMWLVGFVFRKKIKA